MTRILQNNIDLLKKQVSAVKEIILVPQIENLEDELKFSTSIKNIKELTRSKSNSDFKSDFIYSSNVPQLLENKAFDIKKLWSRNANNSFKNYKNQGDKIKLNVKAYKKS